MGVRPHRHLRRLSIRNRARLEREELRGEGASLSVLKCHNRADDGLRTRDLQLGKLALYQLSYVRVGGYFSTPDVALVT
jgi:hypothetical protein